MESQQARARREFWEMVHQELVAICKEQDAAVATIEAEQNTKEGVQAPEGAVEQAA